MKVTVETNGIADLRAKLTSMVKKGAKLAIGYSADYAVMVHEDLEVHHKPPGQAKFLSEPINLLRRDLQIFIRDELKMGKPLQKVLEDAGNKLLEFSKRLVPVDTGNLKNSGYVKVET